MCFILLVSEPNRSSDVKILSELQLIIRAGLHKESLAVYDPTTRFLKTIVS